MFQSKEKDLKIELISGELESAQEECGKAKAQLETANIKIRGLIDECEQVERSKLALQELVDGLEVEKVELDKKVQQLKA